MIGVAGSIVRDFLTEHIVHTVQAASKHFDHHPEFLGGLMRFWWRAGWTVRGTRILLRTQVRQQPPCHFRNPCSRAVIGTTAA